MTLIQTSVIRKGRVSMSKITGKKVVGSVEYHVADEGYFEGGD
jgi:hypothetical protein